MPIFNQVVSGGGGSAPAHYVEKSVDANGKLVSGSTMIDLTGVTDIGDYVLTYAYNNTAFPANTSIDMSSITSISGPHACENMFKNAYGITNVNLGSLATITGANACENMFNNVSTLASVNLSSLTTIGSSCANMFYSTALTGIALNSLTRISAYQACSAMFSSCSQLTSAQFNALNVMTVQISSSMAALAVFAGCVKLESVEFGGLTASTFSNLTNQIQYLFNSTTGSTAPNGCTVHFPSNFDPSDPSHTFDASTLAGYPTFGGNASYIHVAFDLPATE